MKPRLAFFATLVAVLGCEHDKPNFTYMPDMAYSPANKAQEAQDGTNQMRGPVPGTVPRGFRPYLYTDRDVAGASLRNPLDRTRSTLVRGQEMYNVYCIVCHGSYGEGDGSVVPPFPRPPSIIRDEMQKWPDGKIFHVITKGQNNMPTYASQIDMQDRWAIVHYLRALYRAKNPSAADKAAVGE